MDFQVEHIGGSLFTGALPLCRRCGACVETAPPPPPASPRVSPFKCTAYDSVWPWSLKISKEERWMDQHSSFLIMNWSSTELFHHAQMEKRAIEATMNASWSTRRQCPWCFDPSIPSQPHHSCGKCFWCQMPWSSARLLRDVLEMTCIIWKLT